MDDDLHHRLRAVTEGNPSRREVLAAAAALGLSLGAADLLAACGSSPSSGAGGSPGSADLLATITLAASEDTWPAQGTGAKSTTFAYPLNVNVYEPLIALAPDYSLQPGLAVRWELIPPTTWRFHLRPGVRFHDGRPLTADDVLWTWGERQMKGKTLSTVTSTLGPDSVRKVDDLTVDFVPTVPNLRLPEQIVHPEGAIVPRGRDFDSTPPIGTGPFRVTDYRPRERVTLARFDGYWGTRARVRQMTYRFLPDPQTRLQALRAGQVDFVLDVPPASVASLSSDPGFRVVRSRPGQNQLIYINKTGTPPHDLGADPAVREAVAVGLDRRAYVSTVFAGNADPGRWMAPQFVLGRYADLVAPVPYDPTRATRALDAAGWARSADGIRAKGGRRLSLDLIGWAEVTPVAFQFIQAQLRQVGIEVNIKPAADTPTYTNYYRNTQFDLDLEVPNQNDGNPAFLPVLRMYSRSPETFRFAPGGEFDVWAQRALQAANDDGARQASAQMMRILEDGDHIVVPLAGVKRIYGMRSTVDLPNPHPSQTNQSWTGLSVRRS